jgi:hypothetical protein
MTNSNKKNSRLLKKGKLEYSEAGINQYLSIDNSNLILGFPKLLGTNFVLLLEWQPFKTVRKILTNIQWSRRRMFIGPNATRFKL